jgi:hypothetical protein
MTDPAIPATWHIEDPPVVLPPLTREEQSVLHAAVDALADVLRALPAPGEDAGGQNGGGAPLSMRPAFPHLSAAFPVTTAFEPSEVLADGTARYQPWTQAEARFAQVALLAYSSVLDRASEFADTTPRARLAGDVASTVLQAIGATRLPAH